MTAAGLARTGAAALRATVPGASLVVLLLASVLPVPVAHFGVVAPALPLMALYYWVMLRPDLVPRILVFAVGLVQDALLGAPLGVHALVYLLAHAVVLSQRRAVLGRPFWLFWSGFALIAPAALLVRWIAMSILRGTALAPEPLIVSAFLTLALFPLFAGLLFQLQRALVGGGKRDA